MSASEGMMTKKRTGTTKGYLIERVERGQTIFLVGAKDENEYEGPRAKIDWDNTWLNITTDEYEGHAMLNIEALEPLREALAKISLAIR
jgi:hypothetical protein